MFNNVLNKCIIQNIHKLCMNKYINYGIIINMELIYTLNNNVKFKIIN